MIGKTMRTAMVLLLLAMQFPASAGAADAGAIQRVSGTVTITGADNTTRVAAVDEKIRAGDTVSTDAAGETMIRMSDRSTVALRPNTQFRINAYAFEEKAGDSLFSTLLRGAVRMVTGLVGKSHPENYTVQANMATIGIRGTDFEVAILEEGSSDGRPGVYSAVNDGGTTVRIVSGERVDVEKDQTAFAPAKPEPGEAPLQVLDTRPAFFRGGGFDSMMHQVTSQPMRSIQFMRR